MLLTDYSHVTRPVLDRAAREADPDIRRILELCAAHIQAELDGNLEATMATLVAEPLYHIYNLTRGDGTTFSAVNQGQAAIRRQYIDSIAAGSAQDQDYHIDHVVADRYGVALDGFIRVPWGGAALKALGHDTEENGSYLYEGRCSSFWPVDAETGRFTGEDIYFDPAGFRDIASRRID